MLIDSIKVKLFIAYLHGAVIPVITFYGRLLLSLYDRNTKTKMICPRLSSQVDFKLKSLVLKLSSVDTLCLKHWFCFLTFRDNMRNTVKKKTQQEFLLSVLLQLLQIRYNFLNQKIIAVVI